MTSDKLSEGEIAGFFQMASAWIQKFTFLGGKLPGHEKARVTPYMHTLAYHIPPFLQKLHSVKQFTCQHVEKKNDDIRRAHLLKSNHVDSCLEIMTSSKRMDKLRKRKRQKRHYSKSEHTENIPPKQRKQQKTVGVEITNKTMEMLEEQREIEKLTTHQIKQQLKNYGIEAKNKSHSSLVAMAMYCKTM
jgi:hypothetical protein